MFSKFLKCPDFSVKINYFSDTEMNIAVKKRKTSLEKICKLTLQETSIPFQKIFSNGIIGQIFIYPSPFQLVGKSIIKRLTHLEYICVSFARYYVC